MDATASGERALKAAAFLAQALELDPVVDPHLLAADLALLQLDPHAAIFAAELDSSVGPTAFLVYVYAFEETDSDGRPGRDLFDLDLATLTAAAGRDAPGPRLVAHAVTAGDGFILATTPATLRALRGETSPEAIESLTAGPELLLPTGETAEARRTGAEELLGLLRAANVEATRWLAALQAEGRVLPEGDSNDPVSTIAFNDAETELALFLLDERSIQALLRTLNLLLTAARQGTVQALARGEMAVSPPALRLPLPSGVSKGRGAGLGG